MRCFISELKIGELTGFQVQKDSKCQWKMAVNAVEMSAVVRLVKAVKLWLKEQEIQVVHILVDVKDMKASVEVNDRNRGKKISVWHGHATVKSTFGDGED